MYPAYAWTNSYPHHSNPTAYTPSDNPRAQPYQPWPYSGNYCYPAPQYNGYFGSPYAFQPPYPHYPPPPFYPPFPGTCPAYSVCPPHFSLEQPRYEYDKKTHCYGCPNHSCKHEDDTNVKVERKEPEVDKVRNYPYPIVWVPPGYMKNNELEATEKEKLHHDHEISKPLDIKFIEPSKQSGNDKGAQDQQSRDGYNLPFPIFWLHSKNNEAEKDPKENILGQAGSNESKGNEESSGSEADSDGKINKSTVRKVIPVKQMGAKVENESPKATETKARGPVANSVEEGKAPGSEGKKQPSSMKASKLPPVSLRLEPLPRKKNGKGSSRSPSPPADKGRSKESSKDDAQPSPKSLNKTKEKEPSKNNVKKIEVTDGKTSEDINVHMDKGPSQSQSLVNSCQDVLSDSKDQDCEKGNIGEKGKEETNKAERRKKLSENEAALIIQCVYRGFEVRKSQPLMKLKRIAEVEKQAAEVRNLVHELESSSQIDNKRKVIVNETIMSLLLKLDTIQGLHPTVRDVRKSVAKELVGLQEKLDSLTLKSKVSSVGTKPSDLNCEEHSMKSQLGDHDQPLMSVEREQGIENPPALIPDLDSQIFEKSEASGDETTFVTKPCDMNSAENAMNPQQGDDQDQPQMSVEKDVNVNETILESAKGIDQMENEATDEGEIDVEDSKLEPLETEVGDQKAVEAASDRKLMEENERLREVVESLIRRGNKQVAAISKLSWKVRDLEKKVSRKKKVKRRKCRGHASAVKDMC